MIDSNLSTYATVAQLVEQLIRNQQVAGSNPASSSKNAATAYAVAAFLSIFPLFFKPLLHTEESFLKYFEKLLTDNCYYCMITVGTVRRA